MEKDGNKGNESEREGMSESKKKMLIMEINRKEKL